MLSLLQQRTFFGVRPGRRGRRALRGFTLLELVVAIVILGVLAALAVPTFSSVAGASQLGVVKGTAHGIDHDAVAKAAFDHLPAGANDPATGVPFVVEAYHELGGTSGWTVTPVGDFVHYTVSRLPWSISVCLSTSATPGVYGMVTAGACAGSGGSGGGPGGVGGGGALTITPVPGSPFGAGGAPDGVVYSPSNTLAASANFGDGTVTVYSVASTGVLAPVAGSPFTSGSGAADVSFSAEGTLLAVPNWNDNTVSVFHVNTTTGALTMAAGSPVALPDRPATAVFSGSASTHEFLTLAGANVGTVLVYAVNASTGTLTAVSGSPFAAGTSPQDAAVSPVIGGHVFVASANGGSGNVSVFSMNTATGALTPVAGSPFAAGVAPEWEAFGVSGGNPYLASTDISGNNVYMFALDPATGALTPAPGSPVSIGAGTAPYTDAFSPDGSLLAVADDTSSGVSIYSVTAATGALTPVTGSPFSTGPSGGGGAGTNYVSFSPNGKFLSTANFNTNSVSSFAISPPVGP